MIMLHRRASHAAAVALVMVTSMFSLAVVDPDPGSVVPNLAERERVAHLPARVEASIRDYLARAEAAGFSGAVALGQGGSPLIEAGFGSLTCSGPGRVTADTPFYIASLSKAFTAAAILKLETEGVLRVADPIARHLPNVPPDKQRITLHQLLTHTSGLGRPAGLPPGLDPDAYVDALLAQPLRSEPGTQESYSNAGYSLLAAIVQRASGRDFGDYLRSHLFEPAGMTRTDLVTKPRDWERGDLAHACNGGLEQGSASLQHHAPFDWGEVGAIGVVSTAADLLRWIRALRAGTVLPEEAVDRMFASHGGRYGYGWVHSVRSSGRTLLWHTGQLLPEGWNGQIRIYPERDLTLVVLSNRHDGEPLGWVVTRAVDRIISGGDIAFPPPLAAFDDGAGDSLPSGEFQLEQGGAFRIRRNGKDTDLIAEGQRAVDLLMGINEERAASLEAANRRTERFMDFIGEGLDRIPQELAGRPPEEWAPRLKETWQWLNQRFGPFQGFSVLHSVPAPFGDDAALTFVRLEFADQATTVRLMWAGGGFRGMSDRGAFVGTTPAVAVLPGPLPLTRTGPEHYTGFQLASGTGLEIEVLTEADNCTVVRIHGPDDAGVGRAGDCD